MIDRRLFLAAGAVAAASFTGGCTTLFPAPSRFVSDRISVTVAGSGPDVVLIPGLATSRNVWAGTVAAVPGYRYHLVQVAGFAGAPPLANAQPGPLLESVAAEIERYIVEQGLVRPAVVGHSLGGLLALMTAAAVPSVSKTMVVDMVPFGAMLFKGPDVTAEQAVAIGADARERYFGANRVAATERLYATMIRTDAARPAFVAQALASDADVSGRLFEEVAATDLRPRLKSIRGPVTVLYVSAPNIPVGDQQTDALYRAAYRDLPGARLKRIEGSFHFIMLDQPAAFAQELRAFLR
ncbi:alpha/beta hydrolase [Sphingomonas sinipercae]|uniref:Alpha/beta hydrolase n=1 Tax=Sphingomonas sinipercae TaxID=2714944 RepID=A0A6G7ZPM2_9SPHN|nr:alpha/beta hydrolase [Sphingomonas sinipercae]QIL02934.1 alpha/beta hydrolase [Sphingomonas sinipercae]